MRILITGAAGFIGSHLARRLLADNYTVVGIDDYSTGRPDNIEDLLSHKRFTFIRGDVLDLALPNFAADWVLHFASPASPPKYLTEPVRTMRVNAEGTRRLLDYAGTQSAGFLFASTSEVYGDPLIHPQTEEYWGNVSITGPRSVYDEGKRYGEALVHAYHRAYGLSTRVVRIFNTYGPGMDPDDGRVVSNLICQALQGHPMTIYGDGQQTRSFQYVDDLVEGIIRLLHIQYSGPVNLGNPVEYTMNELADTIERLVGKHSRRQNLPLPQDDPRQRCPDITLAKELLGWSPVVPLEEGLTHTINYFSTTLLQTIPCEK